MKKSYLLIWALFLVGSVFAQNQLTIYNDNLSLVRTKLILKLDKGRQDYNFDDITSQIDAASVLVKTNNNDLSVISQNYEYDLANSAKILSKFIGKDIVFYTKGDAKYTGNLQFIDSESAGIVEHSTSNLLLVKYAEILNFQLPELPSNFYKRPTLHWLLSSPAKSDYPVTLSYLTGGMSWYVTYNAVWDDTNLLLNSWVTINNNSGKAFKDYKLKLVAGDVNQARSYMQAAGGARFNAKAEYTDTMAPPSFEEKSFHDFHMYTLSETVDVADNQIKQMQLYPAKTVKAKPEYIYQTWGNKVASKIVFKNSKVDGLGLPLPKGTVKVYKLDTADDNMEFIGEDDIDHTAVDEEVRITTGNAFDLVGETLVTDSRRISDRISERDFRITLKNHSKLTKTIIVMHNKSEYTKIIRTSLPFTEKGASLAKFAKELAAGEEFTFTFIERTDR